MKAAALAWVIVGFLLALLAQPLAESLWILAAIPFLVWAASGVVLLGVGLWWLRRPELRREAAIGVSILLVGALSFPLVAAAGDFLTKRVRITLQRPEYERVVAGLRIRPLPAGVQESDGLRYVVDPGPPVRVAFIWPGGVIDNWCGAVYDKTGAVMRANAFDGEWSRWEEQVPAEIIGLFGGNLVHCEELAGTYYHCCFT